jgi:predicted transcriptional regulator
MALGTFLNVRITPAEKALLDRLARESGRSRSAVARGLLLLAVNNQETVRALGELPMVEPSKAEPAT